MTRYLIFLWISLLLPCWLTAQESLISSRNGEVLPVHGTIRVLLVFIEVEYPDGKDKFASEAGIFWKPGTYPTWAGDLFDPLATGNPKGQVTRYFYESSFGDYLVLGDILLNPDNPGAPFLVKSNGELMVNTLLNDVIKKGFITSNALPADSFDLWKKSTAGAFKVRSAQGDVRYFDHIMFIARNGTYPGNLAGFASAGNLSAKGDFKTDTYSVFSSRNANPLNILLHEFNHLLFGGNNVHCCGGNHASSGPQMFLSFQGGWGMMGAANKSLMTCNAYDRYKLGWKRPEKHFFISAMDTNGHEIETDFDFSDGKCLDTMLVIRDFVTYGDAVRIRLPGIPENEYQQYLWIENHRTKSFNQSSFDVFQYEHESCVDKAVPGLYMFTQVGHNKIEGKEAFGGYADFIRPLPASGMYDFVWGDTLVRNNWCVGHGLFYPFQRLEKFRNPLSGNAVSEMAAYDDNGDNHLAEKEKRDPAIELVNGEYRNNLPYLGESGFAFQKNGNNKIGVGTNPSSANSLTLLNDNRAINKYLPPDNRVIYLNSVSVEIVREDFPTKGDVLIRVQNGDNTITENVRWCAPQIVLGPIASTSEYSLILDARRKITLDAGRTPTRIDSVITIKGENFLTDYTHFTLLPGSKMLLRAGAKLELKNGSTLHISKGATIVLEKGAEIDVSKDSHLINDGEIIKQ